MWQNSSYYIGAACFWYTCHKSITQRNHNLQESISAGTASCGEKQTFYGNRHCLDDVLFFLRTSYNDTLTYIDSFRNAETLVEGFANGTFTDWTGNPWSMFYRSLMHDLTKNYHIYFFFPAF